VIKHFPSSAAATLAILAFTALGGVISARYLLPTGKGQLTAVILWPTFLALLGSLGLAEAVTYFTARQRGDSRDILSTALVLALGAAAVVVTGGYFLLPILLSKHDAETLTSARVFLLYVPVSLAATVMMAALQGNLRLGAYNALRTMVQVLTVAGMVLLAVTGHVSVRGFVTATLVANVLTFVVAAILVLKAEWIRWPFPSAVVKPLLHFGLRSHLGSFASMLNLRLDQMLMAAFMSASLLGIYVVAVTVAGLANLAATTLSVIAVPKISGEHDPRLRVRHWGRILRLTILLQVVLACTLWLLAPYIVNLFFGNSFAPSTRISRVLLVASVPLGINIILAVGFRAFNRPLTPSTAEIVSLAVTTIGLLLLLRSYGPLGAAWASLIAYTVTCGFLLSRVYTQLGINPRDLLEPNRQDWRDAWALLARRNSKAPTLVVH
jgi:O-antigen/teichoic acid export membrane protein